MELKAPKIFYNKPQPPAATDRSQAGQRINTISTDNKNAHWPDRISRPFDRYDPVNPADPDPSKKVMASASTDWHSNNRSTRSKSGSQLEASRARRPSCTTRSARLRRELADTNRRIYASLKPWETVEVARHPDRPMTTDYLELVFDEFVELHGDKFFGDDRAIRTGFAKLDDYKVMVVGHQKGQNAQGAQRVLLRLRPSRRLPQGDGQDAAGRQVPACRSSA